MTKKLLELKALAEQADTKTFWMLWSFEHCGQRDAQYLTGYCFDREPASVENWEIIPVVSKKTYDKLATERQTLIDIIIKQRETLEEYKYYENIQLRFGPASQTLQTTDKMIGEL